MPLCVRVWILMVMKGWGDLIEVILMELHVAFILFAFIYAD